MICYHLLLISSRSNWCKENLIGLALIKNVPYLRNELEQHLSFISLKKTEANILNAKLVFVGAAMNRTVSLATLKNNLKKTPKFNNSNYIFSREICHQRFFSQSTLIYQMGRLKSTYKKDLQIFWSFIIYIFMRPRSPSLDQVILL